MRNRLLFWKWLRFRLCCLVPIGLAWGKSGPHISTYENVHAKQKAIFSATLRVISSANSQTDALSKTLTISENVDLTLHVLAVAIKISRFAKVHSTFSCRFFFGQPRVRFECVLVMLLYTPLVAGLLKNFFIGCCLSNSCLRTSAFCSSYEE